MSNPEGGPVQSNFLEQFFIRQQKVGEVVSQKGPLSAEHASIIASYLFDNIETMANVSKGSRLESPGGSVSITFGGVDDISHRLINESWERIRDAESIQINAGIARKMLLIWASARHWDGGYNTIASDFIEPNLDTVAKILRSTVKEDFAKESVGEYERKYHQEVLDYIDSKKDSTDGYLEDFKTEKSKVFLQAVIADEKSDLSDVEIAYKLIFADDELNDGASLAMENVGARLQKAISAQDSQATIGILRIINIEYGDFAKNSEFEEAIREIDTFILDNLGSLSWKKIDYSSPREVAMLFVGRFFDLLSAEKQKQYLENIQSIMNKKASEGFDSLEDLEHVSKQAAFLYREKRFGERKNQKEGNVGDLAEFIGENKPFIEAFFTTLNQFKESAKSPEEITRIREIGEQGSLPDEFKVIIETNPELFIDEARYYLPLLYPDGNVERDVLTAFVKKPQSWLKIIKNHLSDNIRRFDYVSDDFPNSPHKLTSLMLEKLKTSLSQSFPDSASSLHDIQNTVEASDEWKPGEPPTIWSEDIGEQIDENIQNHFFEIAHPYLVLGIGRDSNFQISEPQKEMIEQNLRNLWNGLSKEEKRPILGLMLWSLQELNEGREQIHAQLVGTPDGIADARQRSTRSFNQLQSIIRGLFSSFPTEEIVESRKDTLFSLAKRLWDSKDERIIYETKDKLIKLRRTILEEIAGTDLTLEQYMQTDKAWQLFRRPF